MSSIPKPEKAKRLLVARQRDALVDGVYAVVDDELARDLRARDALDRPIEDTEDRHRASKTIPPSQKTESASFRCLEEIGRYRGRRSEELLLQNLNHAFGRFESITVKTLTPEAAERTRALLSKIRIEVLVSDQIDPRRLASRVRELTAGFVNIPIFLLSGGDIQATVDAEYQRIGDI